MSRSAGTLAGLDPVRCAAIAAVVALIGMLTIPSPSSAAPSCLLDGDVLEIRVPAGLEDFGAVSRAAGGALVVSGAEGATACEGPQPTVANTRKILINAPDGARSVAAVNLAGGPLAPGAAGSEAEGRAAEIEVVVSLRDRFDILLLIGRGGTSGGAADDRIQLGSKRGSGLANLNVPGDGGEPDADLRALGVERTVVYGQGGDDRLEGSGGKGTGARFDSGELFLLGAGGRDRLLGGADSDLLTGGAGADRLAGGPGKDALIGGGAVDRAGGGRGNDFIRSRDGRRERIACGRGARDIVQRDDRDRLHRSCEFITAERREGSAGRRLRAQPRRQAGRLGALLSRVIDSVRAR